MLASPILAAPANARLDTLARSLTSAASFDALLAWPDPPVIPVSRNAARRSIRARDLRELADAYDGAQRGLGSPLRANRLA